MSVILNSDRTEYITDQGDIWDIISLRCYGDTHAMHFVQDANFDYRFVDAFPANVRLVIPSRVQIGMDLRPVQTPDIRRMLPWR